MASLVWSRCICVVPALALATLQTGNVRAFVFSAGLNDAPKVAAASNIKGARQPVGNVLILDHLNINHERGRHDLLKAFYFDFLKCAVDPRKESNLSKGSKTLWANVGANQFHLPEGNPDAQIFDGVVTLSYRTLDGLKRRRDDDRVRSALDGTKFDAMEADDDDEDDAAGGCLRVTDPWGTKFVLRAADASARDGRGSQPGSESEGLGLSDLTVYAPIGSDFAGIGRFYDRILGAPVLSVDDRSCVLSVGPGQTLTFVEPPLGATTTSESATHVDLVDEGEAKDGKPRYLSNYGPHVSVYVSDLRSTYERAVAVGATYVNPRFKRRAYTLEEALDDCMFRAIDIVDPENVEAGPILKLEHEVRSVVKRDGSMYKSCPFDEIPVGCVV